LSIARQAFEPLQRDYTQIWEIMDYAADTMYFIDIAIQFRTGYLEQGIIGIRHIIAPVVIEASKDVYDQC
jgi:hypothetical protein